MGWVLGVVRLGPSKDFGPAHRERGRARSLVDPGNPDRLPRTASFG